MIDFINAYLQSDLGLVDLLIGCGIVLIPLAVRDIIRAVRARPQ